MNHCGVRLRTGSLTERVLVELRDSDNGEAEVPDRDQPLERSGAAAVVRQHDDLRPVLRHDVGQLVDRPVHRHARDLVGASGRRRRPR